MTDISNKLREARALIERGWCQRAYGRDADGCSVYEDNPSAICWCASGAINAKADYAARRVFGEAIGTDCIPGWNDAPERTQAEVLAAFDKAIELAEAQS
jgi:hypothetical protein